MIPYWTEIMGEYLINVGFRFQPASEFTNLFSEKLQPEKPPLFSEYIPSSRNTMASVVSREYVEMESNKSEKTRAITTTA